MAKKHKYSQAYLIRETYTVEKYVLVEGSNSKKEKSDAIKGIWIAEADEHYHGQKQLVKREVIAPYPLNDTKLE
jgi:predicted small secreted protein